MAWTKCLPINGKDFYIDNENHLFKREGETIRYNYPHSKSGKECRRWRYEGLVYMKNKDQIQEQEELWRNGNHTVCETCGTCLWCTKQDKCVQAKKQRKFTCR